MILGFTVASWNSNKRVLSVLWYTAQGQYSLISVQDFFNIWASPCKKVSYALSDVSYALHCPITELLDTTEYNNVEQRPGWYFANMQFDVNPNNLRMFKGILKLYAAHIISKS